MAYVTADVLTDPTPTTTLLGVLETMMTAEASWSFIEETVASSYTARVWKCDGAVNNSGTDFYMAITRASNNLAAGDLVFMVGEGYDLVAHKLVRIAPAGANFAVAADGSYATPLLPAWGYGGASVPISVSATAFTYWLRVTGTAVILKSSLTTYPVWAGLFEPFYPAVPNEVPVGVISLGQTYWQSNDSGVTRRPGSENVANIAYPFFACISPADGNTFSQLVGVVPVGSVLTTGRSVGSRVLLTMYTPYPDGSSARGFVPDLLVFKQDPAVAAGDTLLVGEDTYVCIYDSPTRGLWLNTAGA